MLKHWKAILGQAIPSSASYATITILGTFNLIILGKISVLAVAIVGVVNILIYNTWALFAGIGHTISYLTAQNYGAGDMSNAIRRMNIALLMCLGVAAVVIVGGMATSHGLLSVLGGSDRLANAGEAYLQLRFAAMALGIASFVFHGFLRGIGRKRLSMLLTIITNTLILVFTSVLTLGFPVLGIPSYGIAGAGTAFLIGELFNFIGCTIFYFFVLHRSYRTRSFRSLGRAEAGLIGRESVKLGLQEFALSISMFVFTLFVMRLGEKALAANEIVMNIISVGFVPAYALATAATVLVGQEIGRGKPRVGRAVGIEASIIAGVLLFIVGGLEFVFAMPISNVFTADRELRELVAAIIRFAAFVQVIDALLNVCAGSLRGAGDTTFLLKVSLFSGVCILVPLTYVFTDVLQMGSIGAWLSFYIFVTVYGVLTIIRFYRTDWNQVRTKSIQNL